MKKLKEFVASGRRKTAVASVRLREGNGKVEVNGKTLEQYFPLKLLQDYVLAPLKKLDLDPRFDMKISVKGGGVSGQAGAVRHGIARTLVSQEESSRGALKASGFLTRDARKKERKKYGKKKARKSFQFSKR